MYVNGTSQSQTYTSQTQKTPPSAEDIFSKIMQSVDTDEDGSISSQELSALDEKQQLMLSQADTDGNGVISEDELLSQIADKIASMDQMKPQGEKGMPSVADMIERIMLDADTDGDGEISTEELSALDEDKQAKLSRADTDGNGIITQDELSSQLESDMAARGDMPPPPPPPSQDMTMNSFKDMLITALESTSTQSSSSTDMASQLQNFLQNLGFSETQSSDLISMLEGQRFDITA